MDHEINIITVDWNIYFNLQVYNIFLGGLYYVPTISPASKLISHE